MRSVLEEAFARGVSDIHLEPRREDMLVRYRCDGALRDGPVVSRTLARPVIARVKALANLDITQHRLPQDGRTQFRYEGSQVGLHVATMPTLHGEGAVLRLSYGARLQRLEDLDFEEAQLAALAGAVACREGLVLAAGPKGSGRSTTLFALLHRVLAPDRKVIALEDPIEREVDGITQIAAAPQLGLSMTECVRSALRQDPDVLLVAELEDRETVDLAVRASLSHLVLSAIHASGAVETVTRLLGMGVDPLLLGDSLRAVVGQRLVRRVCQECRRPAELEPELAAAFANGQDAEAFVEGRGCEACCGVGYHGRLGVHEVLRVTPRFAEAVRRAADSEELHGIAAAEGLVSLTDDGVNKARAGVTTLQEILAATTRG